MILLREDGGSHHLVSARLSGIARDAGAREPDNLDDGSPEWQT